MPLFPRNPQQRRRTAEPATGAGDLSVSSDGRGGMVVRDGRPDDEWGRIASHVSGNEYTAIRLDDGDDAYPDRDDLTVQCWEVGGSASVPVGTKVRLEANRTGPGFTFRYGAGAANYLAPVRVATTTAGTLGSSFAAGQTVDGVLLVAGDAILIRNQTSADQNGTYTVNSSGAPTRRDTSGAALFGAIVPVMEGTVHGDSLFKCELATIPNVGVDPLSFQRIGPLRVAGSSFHNGVWQLNFSVADGVSTSSAGDGALNVHVNNPLGSGVADTVARWAGTRTLDDSNAAFVAVRTSAATLKAAIRLEGITSGLDYSFPAFEVKPQPFIGTYHRLGAVVNTDSTAPGIVTTSNVLVSTFATSGGVESEWVLTCDKTSGEYAIFAHASEVGGSASYKPTTFVAGKFAIGGAGGVSAAGATGTSAAGDTVVGGLITAFGAGGSFLTSSAIGSTVQGYDADLAALAAVTGTGLLTRTGAGTAAARTLTAGSSKVSVANGDGVSGNPTVDVVESNLTLGNLGGTLSVAKGGTGATAHTAYAVLCGGTTGTGAVQSVASLGTAGQVLTSNGAGALPTFQNAAAAGVPVGTVIAHVGSSVPAGYLECNGSLVSRTTYAALFAVVGTNFGSGDGSTTFGVPNLERRVLVGSGGLPTSALSNAVGALGGTETHTLTVAEMPSHTHPHSAGGVNFWADGTSFRIDTGAGPFVLRVGTLQNTGGGAAHNNIQPSMVVRFCIKF